MNKEIYVIYVGILNIPNEYIEEYVKSVAEKIAPTEIDGEIIVIPVMELNTRIECINPRYITNKELITEHNSKIKKINDELEKQIQFLKNEK